MSLLNFVTGGKTSEASSDLRRAQGYLDNVQTPTVAQLTLPELQEYVNAGLMTPAQMESYLQQSNAYNDQNIDQTGTDAQIQALNKLSGVANAGAKGTAVSQAQQEDAIDKMNQATGGQRGAIEQTMAAKGTPAAMIQAALANQYQGQDAQQAHRDSLQAQAQAYQQAVDAMAKGADVGGQLQGQQNTQANTVAAAKNAMQQFNAQNQQNASANNASLKQQANQINQANAQDVSNQNTSTKNQRTSYNANLPNTVFQNQMQKATGQANVAGQQANQATAQGQQQAGLTSSLIGAGATMFGGPVAGMAASQATKPNMGPAAHGGIAPDPHGYCYHDGGICMEGGGMVPGEPEVPGDSLQNDTVDAHLSPGEAVIPRTAVQENLPQVLELISGHSGQESHHPMDIASLLAAMKEIRMGASRG